MVIIKCPECGNEVSDQAEKCPKCGINIAWQPISQPVQTIELTSKKYKSRQVVLRFAIIAGIILLLSLKSDDQFWIVGWILILGGLIWLIVVKIEIWWNNR